MPECGGTVAEIEVHSSVTASRLVTGTASPPIAGTGEFKLKDYERDHPPQGLSVSFCFQAEGTN